MMMEVEPKDICECLRAEVATLTKMKADVLLLVEAERDALATQLATVKTKVKRCVTQMCESATDTVWAGSSTMADALADAIGEDTLGPDGWPLALDATPTEARYTQAEIDDGKAKAAEWAPMFDKPTDTEEG